MYDDKDNLILEYDPSAKLSDEEKIEIINSSFPVRFFEDSKPEDIKYYPKSNLRVVLKRMNGLVMSTVRNYYSYDRQYKRANIQAGVDFGYDFANHLEIINKVKSVDFYKTGDSPTSPYNEGNHGAIKADQDALSFQGGRSFEDSSHENSNHFSMSIVEGRFTRLDRRLVARYDSKGLAGIQFSLLSPGITPYQSGVIPGIVGGNWSTDIESINYYLANNINIGRLVSTLKSGTLETNTQIGRLTLEYNPETKDITIRRLNSSSTDETDRPADEIVLPIKIDSIDETFNNFVNERNLVDDPIGCEPSYDHNWLYADFMKVLGIKWKPARA